MSEFKVGDVVTLRSGGPNMVITRISQSSTFCMYFNAVSGKFEEISVNSTCIKSPFGAPETPRSAQQLRGQGLA